MHGRPCGPAFGLLGPPAVPVHELLGPVQGRLVVARVEDQAGRGVVRELLGRDEVPGPDLVLAHADGHRQGVHGTFDGVGGLRSTGTPVGVGRRQVGEHAPTGERVHGHVVEAVVEERPEQRNAGGHQLQVRPHVGQEGGPHARQLPVGVGSQLDGLALGPTLDGRRGGLRTGLGPPHRHAVAVGQRHADQLLGVDVQLAAESTAHARGHDPQFMLRHAQGEGSHHLQHVGDLGRRVERHVPVVRGRHDGHAAGLHRRGDEPLVHVCLGHVVDGILEGGGDAVRVRRELPVVGDVGSAVLVDDQPVAGGVPHVDDGLQRFVVDHHSL